MNNVVRVLVLSAIAGGLFNVSVSAEQATDNTLQVQATQDLDIDAGLNLSDENSDNWWGGWGRGFGWGGWGGWGGGFGWGGWGGWGGFGWGGCGGWGFPYYAYYPWYFGGFGWGGCGGWGWGC